METKTKSLLLVVIYLLFVDSIEFKLKWDLLNKKVMQLMQ